MKATELRLGNDILNNKNEVESVFTLYEDSINGYDGNAGIIPDDEGDFKPIPLTEEWLLKLGFEKDGFDIALLMQKARLGFIYYGGLPHQLDIIQDGKQLAMSANCAIYVHQLQNLYFALTGTELTIN